MSARVDRAVDRIVGAAEIVLFPLLWTIRKLMLVPAVGWRRVGLTLAIAPFPLWLAARVHVPHGTLRTTWVYGGGDLALISAMGCIMVLWLLGQFALDHLAVAIVRRASRLLPVRGNGALALARHTLDSRRAVGRKGYWASKQDLGSLVMLAVVVVGALGAQTIDSAKELQLDALTFDATVLPADAASGNQSTLGVDRAELSPTVLAALDADPALAVVPFGLVTVGPVGAASPTSTITIVAPDDLARITPDGARPLGLQDGFLLSPDSESAALAFPAPPHLIDLSTGAGTATVFHRPWFNTNTFATRSWAEATWGDVSVAGALVKYVGDDLSTDDRLTYIEGAAARAGAEAQPTPTMSAEDAEYRDTSGAFSRGAFGFFTFYFVILVGFAVIMISVRTVKAHRQVRATVAALGATPRALAAAVSTDAAISLAVALAIGAPLGALVAAIIAHPTLLSPGAPLDPANTAWGLWWNLTHIAWAQMAVIVVATWLVAVAAATVYGLTVARRTPVDELRVAIKEGAQ